LLKIIELRQFDPYRIMNLLTHILNRDPSGKMSCERRKDIPSVEGVADVLQPVARVGRMKDPGILQIKDRCEQAIVRCDKVMTCRFDREHPAAGSNAGINHTQMNRPRRKISERPFI